MYWFLLLCFLPDGELVLRNGKVVRYQGEYSQEGQWVRFTGHKGEYLQLPLKIVDFEKTQARIDGKKAKAAADKEAKRAAAIAKAEKPKVIMSGFSDAVVEDDTLALRGFSVDGIGQQDLSGNVIHRYDPGGFLSALEAESRKPVDSMNYRTLKATEERLTQEIFHLRLVQGAKSLPDDSGSWEPGAQARSKEEAKKAKMQTLKEKLSRVKEKLRELESAEAKAKAKSN